MWIFYLILAAFMVLLGAVVRFGKASWLVSGYNTASREEKEKYDEVKLCNHVGNLTFAFGAIFLLMSMGVAISPLDSDTISMIGWAAFVLTAIGGLVYINTGNRIKK